MSRTTRSFTRAKAFALGVALLATASCGASTGSSGTSGRELKLVADFADASPLIVGNNVMVDGVKVGEVTRMSVVDGHAEVEFTASREALPIHADARVTVRPMTLLGERFLDLTRGTPSAPALSDGQHIPLEHTAQNTDLDEVLNTVDDPTGTALAALVTVLGQGMQGNGKNVASTIKALAPAMTDTDKFVQVLNQQNSTLNSLIDSLQPVADSLANNNGGTLDSLLNSAATTLRSTAARQSDLDAMLREIPSTLAQARTSLATLTGVAQAATPTLNAMRPMTDNLNAISQELAAFSSAATPALARTATVLQRAQRLLDQARPVATELLKASTPLRSSVKAASPLVTKLSDHIGDVMNLIRGWALTTNGADGQGHYFRALVIPTTDYLSGVLPGGSDALPKTPLSPTQSAPQKSAPVTGLLNGLVPGVSQTVGGLLAPTTSGGGVTGLSKTQEGGLLGFLFGGGN